MADLAAPLFHDSSVGYSLDVAPLVHAVAAHAPKSSVVLTRFFMSNHIVFHLQHECERGEV